MSSDSGDETADYPMLDKLAFDCTALSARLAAAKPPDQQRLLREYIATADQLHSPIADFPDDLDWFNVTEPLSTQSALRGKIVILDFFTYCCINCLHVLPDLKRLEQLYTVADGVCVVGVHSAKFANEKDSANILAAVQRYEITHPVVNDSGSAMWQALDVKCWPTLLVLGPRAQPLFVLMGEGNYEQLELYVGAAIKYYGARPVGEGLSGHALPLNPAIELIVSGALQFPGKVACSKMACAVEVEVEEEEVLYAIADTGHHRVLVCNQSGRVLHRIGGLDGGAGFLDGDFRDARFNAPQGVCFRQSGGQRQLYVADTENHAVRLIDLLALTVRTVAGTGQQGVDRVGGGQGTAQPISSPWDVVVCRTRNMDMSFHVDGADPPEHDVLLIACAGLHQIWALFVEDTIWWKYRRYAAGTVVALVGNGNEENRNNSYPLNAAFAQPSGLAWCSAAKELYVADSESSAVRKVQLADGGKVVAVAGGDRNPLNLFAFGDQDGKQYAAKLQHPLGLCYHPLERSIYVADTYNHCIKRIDPATNQCSTFPITSAATDDGGEHTFQEPAGLCCSADGSHLLVADTNNHRVMSVNLRTGRAEPFRLHFGASHPSAEVTDGGANGGGRVPRPVPTIAAERVLRLGATGSFTSLQLSVEFVTAGWKMTADAPQRVHVQSSEPSAVGVQTFADNFCASNPMVLLALGPTRHAAQLDLTVEFRLMLCSGERCFPSLFRVVIAAICGEPPLVLHELEAWKVLVGDGGVELLYDDDSV